MAYVEKGKEIKSRLFYTLLAPVGLVYNLPAALAGAGGNAPAFLILPMISSNISSVSLTPIHPNFLALTMESTCQKFDQLTWL